METAGGENVIISLLGLEPWEFTLIVVVAVVLLGANQLSDFLRGLRSGMNNFLAASRQVQRDLDEARNDRGRSEATRFLNLLPVCCFAVLALVIGASCEEVAVIGIVVLSLFLGRYLRMW